MNHSKKHTNHIRQLCISKDQLNFTSRKLSKPIVNQYLTDLISNISFKNLLVKYQKNVTKKETCVNQYLIDTDETSQYLTDI